MKNLFLKRINKQSVLIGIVSFLMSFSSSCVISCAMDFTKSFAQSGVIVILGRTIGEGLGYIGRFIVGFLSDLSGDRRKFLLIGYGSILFIKPLFAISGLSFIPDNFKIGIYTTANISEKFFGSLRDPIRDAWISDYTEKNDLTINLAIRRFLSYSGSVLGAVFAYFFVNKISYIHLFGIAIIPAFLGVYVLFKSIHNKNTTSKMVIKQNYYKDFLEDMRKNKYIYNFLSLLSGVLLLFIGKINEFILWFAGESIGIFESNQILFIIFYLSSSLGSFLFSLLMNRLSPLFFLFISSLGVVSLNIVLYKYMSYKLMIFATCFYGLYASILDIVSSAIVLKYFHSSKWKATVMSILNLTIGISYAISTFLNKILLSKYGLFIPFYVSLFPILIGLILINFSYKALKENM